MTAVVALFGVLTVAWCLPVLVDGSTWMRLRIHRDEMSLLFDTAADLERAGHHVRDLSLLKGGTFWRIWAGRIPLALILVLLVTGWLLEWERGWFVPTVGLLLGGRGVLSFLGFIAAGHGGMAEDRKRTGWAWYWAGAAARVATTAGGIWVILIGMDEIAATRHRGLILIVLGVLILSLAHIPGIVCEQLGRRSMRAEFAQETEENSALLLRSFSDDRLNIRSPLPPTDIGEPIFPGSYMRFEKALATILKLTHDGVVAIGRPGEKLPELGALRTYWPDDQWQDAVRLTANRCSAVILLAGASDGLAWELDHLREWGLLGKTLVLLPPDPDPQRSRERFDRVLRSLAPEAPACDFTLVPALWTGLRVMPDGTVIHYLSERRDWMGYFRTVVALAEELAGRFLPVPYGEHAENARFIEEAIAEKLSIEEALQRAAERQPNPNAGQKIKRYSRMNFESKRGGLAMIRLGQLNSGIEAYSILNDPVRANQILSDCLPTVDSDRFPASWAMGRFTQIVALLELQRISAGEAVVELTRAFDTAARAESRTWVHGNMLSPPEIQLMIAGAVWELLLSEAESEDEPRIKEAATLRPQVAALLSRAIEVATESGDLQGAAESKIRLARCVHEMGKPAEAEKLGNEAIHIAVNLGNIKLQCKALEVLSNAAWSQKNYRRVLELVTRVEHLSRQAGDDEMLAWALKGADVVRRQLALVSENPSGSEPGPA